MDKTQLRREIKKILSSHKASFAEESQRICNNIIYSEAYIKAKVILAYMALPDEVDLSTVIKRALEDGKEVYLPHVYPDTSKMDFFQFTKDTPVTVGEFGIAEPAFKDTTPKFYAAKDKTLILVPGRAFTKNGERLGRGKGFYDIYLEPHKKNNLLLKAGVCFPCQIQPELPTTPTDIKMDLLFS